MTNQEKQRVNAALDAALDVFAERCREAWANLFAAAKARNEIFFAVSLMAEFRGLRDVGWNTAEESKKAFQEFLELFPKLEATPVKARIALSFYSHLSEAAGLYEMVKNMLLVAGGESYSIWPFQVLVEKNRTLGNAIAPNANKIMKDILGHAKLLGMESLCEIITEAFDADIRNGYAHADYIIWNNNIRLPRRNGGPPREVKQEDFLLLLNRAILFFGALWQQATTSITNYSPPVRVWGRLNNSASEEWIIVEYHPERQALEIRSDPETTGKDTA